MAIRSLCNNPACHLNGVYKGSDIQPKRRYAVRQDIGNKQLKAGVLAAFGLVRGLALAEQLTNDNGISVATVGQGALLCGQSVIIVGFAALALELAFQKQILKPFGSGSLP